MKLAALFSSLLLSLILIFAPSAVLAQNTQTSQDLINSVTDPGAVDVGHALIAPDSPFYFIKAIKERIEMALASTDDVKASRQLEFAQRRLREVNTLVDHKRQDLVRPTLAKYQTEVQNAEDLSSNSQDLQTRVGEALARNIDVLQRVYDQVGNETAKAAILENIQRAESRVRETTQNLPTGAQQKFIGNTAAYQAAACKFFLRESTASALPAADKLQLQQKIKDCQQNVRENLQDQLKQMQQERENNKEQAGKTNSQGRGNK